MSFLMGPGNPPPLPKSGCPMKTRLRVDDQRAHYSPEKHFDVPTSIIYRSETVKQVAERWFYFNIILCFQIVYLTMLAVGLVILKVNGDEVIKQFIFN